ncbi:hypothetical protein PAF17_14710 [Paracoccus sp. Z330]|uniref:Glutamyl-tRNA reductase n=1 Tax=Paracoccus onchidii TaxID=3017813 RepID=A0ABT4ZHF2_9RHOB|nr:hypothetical protein [Paracoccus onchidii]MDB6178746.1 hypothetical protein [Paracoccus onchidii]
MILQIILVVASIGLACFCMVLTRRLRRLNDLETGLGGAIAVMAAEVDRLEQAIRSARSEATEASEGLAQEIARARKERSLWELRQKIGEAAKSDPAQASPTRRLRKRVGGQNA